MKFCVWLENGTCRTTVNAAQVAALFHDLFFLLTLTLIIVLSILKCFLTVNAVLY